MNTAEATRQIYWNISHIWVMYLLLLPTAAVAGYGIYRHFGRWRRGLPAARFDPPLRPAGWGRKAARAEAHGAQPLRGSLPPAHHLRFYHSHHRNDGRGARRGLRHHDHARALLPLLPVVRR